MKLAIEHLQQSIAQTERALSDARNAKQAAQRQADDHAAAVDLNTRKLIDLNAALVELRKPVAPERATVVDQIVKSEIKQPQSQSPVSVSAGRAPPRATLTTKG